MRSRPALLIMALLMAHEGAAEHSPPQGNTPLPASRVEFLHPAELESTIQTVGFKYYGTHSFHPYATPRVPVVDHGHGSSATDTNHPDPSLRHSPHPADYAGPMNGEVVRSEAS